MTPGEPRTRAAAWPLVVPVLLLVASVHGRNLGDFFLSDDFTLIRRASVEPLGSWLLWPEWKGPCPVWWGVWSTGQSLPFPRALDMVPVLVESLPFWPC